MKPAFFYRKYIWIVVFIVYSIVNLLTLTNFPFVHSDEPWLSGLSRNIWEHRDYSVTESFFDLKDRYPHAIKIVFHTIQILFMNLMGYSIFTFRTISLLFGLLCLLVMYRLCKLIFHSKELALAAALLLALDVQFVYASHFARQEIIILFVLLLGLWYKIKYCDGASVKNDLVLGIIIGISIGIHPNSFIISLPFGLIYVYEIIAKRRTISSLLALVGTVACCAILFVAISFYFDPNFIRNYAKYGSEFDVFSPITNKFEEIKLFYQKLYYRVSGTYYTPNITLQFFLFPVAIAGAALKLFFSKEEAARKSILISILLALLSINAGIVIVGRFNQTSIVLIFPLLYITVIYVLKDLALPYRRPLIAGIALLLVVMTTINYLEYKDNSYEKYIRQLSPIVSPQSQVLGNLNMEYYFENNRLHDYRNLAYLEQKGLSFEDYIRNNDIEYIIYSEELDLIHQLQPKWNGIYGPMDYYEEMKGFIKKNCQLVHQFTDSFYGIRIVRYVGIKDWQIKVYKVEW